MKKRNPLVVLLLGLITFGIYDLYWLVKSKSVLNKETKTHTPTIWLLIVPWVLIIVGYALIITGAVLSVKDSGNNSNNAPVAATSSGASTGASNLAVTNPKEELNAKGQRRPSQYLQICTMNDGSEYVTQGSPACLNGDQHTGDYSANVAGTLYSSPCKTTSGTIRYVYVAVSEKCPAGTSLIFYNTSLGSSSSTSVSVPDQSVPASPSSTSNSTSYTSTTSPVYIIGLIVAGVGFLIYFVASVFWFFRFSKAVNEYTKGKMSTAVSFLILYLIHLIGVALIQDTFNEMEASPSSPAGAAPFSMNAVTPPVVGGAHANVGTPPEVHAPQEPLVPPVAPQPQSPQPPHPVLPSHPVPTPHDQAAGADSPHQFNNPISSHGHHTIGNSHGAVLSRSSDEAQTSGPDTLTSHHGLHIKPSDRNGYDTEDSSDDSDDTPTSVTL
jgi:hypothetical protein